MYTPLWWECTSDRELLYFSGPLAPEKGLISQLICLHGEGCSRRQHPSGHVPCVQPSAEPAVKRTGRPDEEWGWIHSHHKWLCSWAVRLGSLGSPGAFLLLFRGRCCLLGSLRSQCQRPRVWALSSVWGPLPSDGYIISINTLRTPPPSKPQDYSYRLQRHCSILSLWGCVGFLKFLYFYLKAADFSHPLLREAPHCNITHTLLCLSQILSTFCKSASSMPPTAVYI